MKRVIGKNWFFCLVAFLFLLLATVTYFDSKNFHSQSPFVEECSSWKEEFSITAQGTSDYITGPDSEQRAKNQALERCGSNKNSLNHIPTRFTEFCQPPCRLSFNKISGSSAPCVVKWCNHVLDDPDSTLKTVCTYTFGWDGSRKGVECDRWDDETTQFPLGWSCYASDGTFKWEAICSVPA